MLSNGGEGELLGGKLCIWLFLMRDVQQRVPKGNREKRRTK